MKILVIHATAGAGHKKAAEAIFHGAITAGHKAVCVDALEYTNPLFKFLYPSVYSFLVTKTPSLWALFFGALDFPFLQPLVRAFRRIYNGVNAKRLEEFLIWEKFDCIITTQFLSAEVCSYLKRRGKISAKVICVVTDFDVHHIWVNRGTDAYAVACKFTKDKLISYGIPEEKVIVTGIPTDVVFTKPLDRFSLRRKMGLKDDLFTVLVATGSFGMGPIEAIVDSLRGVELIVVCGYNKELYDHLSGRKIDHVYVLGLVDNMHELMTMADAMVTKPGGLSIAEALVKHLPMIFFSAIPGQETRNIAVLKKYGAGQDQMGMEEIATTIRTWRTDAKEFARVHESLSILAKPNAVTDIIRLI